MATRHQVRQAVVSLLYAKEFSGENKDFLKDFLKEKKIKNEQERFTISLYEGILSNLKNLDENVAKFLKEDSLCEIDKAILRLGAYELLYTDTQSAVVINEAVELAKELSYENSAKFINAILDSLSKSE
ncbi:transcription antitermination protein [Campylobacter avium LMG 24591]|uniref:Transcription antitermination protein n=1 Tax=Campylobacter avium LMG 24591 TaxID=522484 RepID=A0A222MZI8_9BACT|nr:transcription antitermination factor NusB [Campylobacter avium]ASQ31120.1 transcription antitermination protein [Campylobacter avium LMG 24591]OYD78503.1 transcription antitermination protein [Campylobacter avium]HJE66644.1 transcription antitermination factor NusB [Campylobacter avium]